MISAPAQQRIDAELNCYLTFLGKPLNCECAIKLIKYAGFVWPDGFGGVIEDLTYHDIDPTIRMRFGMLCRHHQRKTVNTAAIFDT